MGQGKAGHGYQDPAQGTGDIEQSRKKQQVVNPAQDMFDTHREIIPGYAGKGCRRRDAPHGLARIKNNAVCFSAKELDTYQRCNGWIKQRVVNDQGALRQALFTRINPRAGQLLPGF